MTLKGDAGFKYTDPDTASTVTVTLAVPLFRPTPGESDVRFATWSLNRKNRDVVTLDDAVDEVWARLRFHSNVSELKALLRQGLNDVTLTYYPSLAVIGTNYPCKLVALDGADPNTFALTPDSARYGFGEFEVRLHLRRVDGGTFDGIFS